MQDVVSPQLPASAVHRSLLANGVSLFRILVEPPRARHGRPRTATRSDGSARHTTRTRRAATLGAKGARWFSMLLRAVLVLGRDCRTRPPIVANADRRPCRCPSLPARSSTPLSPSLLELELRRRPRNALPAVSRLPGVPASRRLLGALPRAAAAAPVVAAAAPGAQQAVAGRAQQDAALAAGPGGGDGLPRGQLHFWQQGQQS
jgi:hypothetical protein